MIGNRDVSAEVMEIFPALPSLVQQKLADTVVARPEKAILEKFPIARFPQVKEAVRRILPTLAVPELVAWLEKLKEISDLNVECLRTCDAEADALGESEIRRVLEISTEILTRETFDVRATLRGLLRTVRKRKFVSAEICMRLDQLGFLDKKLLLRLETEIARRPGILAQLDNRKFMHMLEIFCYKSEQSERFRQSLSLVFGQELEKRLANLETGELLDCMRLLGKIFQGKLRPFLAAAAGRVISDNAGIPSDIACLKFFVKFQLGQVSREPLEFLIDRLAGNADSLSLNEAAVLLEAQCEVQHTDDKEPVARRIDQLIERSEESTLSISRRAKLLFVLADLGLDVERDTVNFLLTGMDASKLPTALKTRLLFACKKLPVHSLSGDRRTEIVKQISHSLLANTEAAEEKLSRDRKSLLILDAVSEALDLRIRALIDVSKGSTEEAPLPIEAAQQPLSIESMMSVVKSSCRRRK